MKFPSIFKVPQHRRFSFKTRYYNAEKEAFDERIRLAQREGATVNPDIESIKDRIRQKYRSRKTATGLSGDHSRMARIAIIALGLSAIFYWILKH